MTISRHVVYLSRIIMEYTFRVKDYQLNIREILDNKQKCYKPNKLRPNLLPRMNEGNIRHDRHVKY